MTNSIRKFKNILLEAHITDGETISKLEANYASHAIGQEQCKYCTHFQAPNSCEIVEGIISPNGWCEYYSPAPITEKWDTATTVAPRERGKFEGKTTAELLQTYNALKKSGPHSKHSTEYGRMRELAFAIRAKTGWGKVSK